ncbi:MAG: Coenzyme F420 hydrogenase/dehydrogenase, beta subunit C-terminal domain [Candidatus Latescibacterota bacterium]
MTVESFDDLKNSVIGRGLCTACGACAGVCPQHVVDMRLEDPESSDPEPILTGECKPCGICYKVCPGRDIPVHALEEFAFGRHRENSDIVGVVRGCHRVWAAHEDIRRGCSSGGAVTSLLAYGLASGFLDGVLLAARDERYPWRCKGKIVTKPEEVLEGVRSVMEIVPTLSVLTEAVEERGLTSLGIVGLPCHIHALRKLQKGKIPPKLARAIKLSVGLFCNSAKHFMGTQHLIEENAGIRVSDIVAMDYRGGEWPGSMLVMTKSGKIHFVATKGQYGSFLASGNYKRDRCTVCIDFAAELADISCGDVFQKKGDDRRISATVVRSQIGEEVFAGALKAGWIGAGPHDVSDIPGSGYGWEASKHANAAKLLQRRLWGWPTPEFGLEINLKPLVRKVHSSTL